MKETKKFSIIFPVMNQEDHIGRVIGAFHRELTGNKISFELITVVNCSTDRSFEECKKVSKILSGVRSYELRGCGYGLGILHGLKKAKGVYLCYLNSARIHPPDLIRTIRHFLIEDTVLVHGVRVRRENTKRGIGSLIYNTFCRTLFRIPNRDINGNPNIFSRKIYERLNLRFTDSMIDLELLERARNLRIPIVEVPVIDYSRHGGISTSNWKTIFRLMKEVLRYFIFTRFPA